MSNYIAKKPPELFFYKFAPFFINVFDSPLFFYGHKVALMVCRQCIWNLVLFQLSLFSYHIVILSSRTPIKAGSKRIISVGFGRSVENHLKNSSLWPLATTDTTWLEGLGVFFGLRPRPTRLDLRVGWVWYWCLRSEVQTVRPQVCSSNSETPGLKFKQWHPRSGAWMLRTQICGLNTESPAHEM